MSPLSDIVSVGGGFRKDPVSDVPAIGFFRITAEVSYQDRDTFSQCFLTGVDHEKMV